MNVVSRPAWLLVVAVLAVPAGNAYAQLQTPLQARCITSLQRSGVGVARTVARNFATCVALAAAGRLPPGETAETCVAGDDQGTIARARARTVRRAARDCRAAPSFGASTAATVNDVFGATTVAQALFGSDLDAAVITAAVDPAGAACQAAALAALERLSALRLQESARCARAGLKGHSIRTAADLERCHETSDALGVQRALIAGRSSVERHCAATSATVAFPGRCASATPRELFDCLAWQGECATCLAVNAAGRLARPCNRFVDGVAREYRDTRRTPAGSIARVWDEEILEAIRHDTPRPTVHARNLFHLSAAMWDAWRAYGGGGSAFLTDERHASADPEADRSVAISFAAYRLLSHRYSLSVNAAATQLHFDRTMVALGFDKRFIDATGASPASVGNRIAAALIAHGRTDGANEDGNYGDPTYVPANDSMLVKLGGTVMRDPNRWQPLALDYFVTQNGIPVPGKVQAAIGMRWNQVTPFALTRSDPAAVYLDPGPPPALGGPSDADFKQAAVRVLELSSQLSPDDGVEIDVSPGAYGNNSLGTNDGTGHPLNPVTGKPYAPQIVRGGDFGRVLAEFWADGPKSETPPGHWNVLANDVTDHTPAGAKRLGGDGPVLSALEWDVKLYLALNGAVHDAAIVAWGLKRKYDSVRPISMIRYMGQIGQSSDPDGPSYDPRGLPLVPGVIEVVTAASSAPGERHAAFARHPGRIVVHAWPGQPADRTTEYGGVRWVRAADWVPYQLNTFVTPAFSGYTSGHSTFSRAAAEVLAAFTGSPYFPGGLGEFVAAANRYLTFEAGPTTDVRLQWATYYDAADQAGQSRLWGGIHIAADDFNGRITGARIGTAAYERALRYFSGAAIP